MLYGYARVSTAFEQTKDRNQTFERQEKILTDYGVAKERIFEDRITGGSSASDRTAYKNLMNVCVPGDMIYVSEMSRISRSLQDLMIQIENLMKRQIGIRFIKEGIEIGAEGLSPMNKMLFQIIGAFNEFEKSLIAERVSQGMQASKARGVKLGRPTIDEEIEKQIIFDYKSGLRYDDLEEKYNISRPTIARICKPYTKDKRKKFEKAIEF